MYKNKILTNLLIIIIIIIINIKTSIENYALTVYYFLGEQVKYKLEEFYINRNITTKISNKNNIILFFNNNTNLYYKGTIINIESLMYDYSPFPFPYPEEEDELKSDSDYSKKIQENLDNIFYLPEKYDMEYIELFPMGTIFIVPYDLKQYIYEISFYKNYTFFLLSKAKGEDVFIFEVELLYMKESLYYIKIGKDLFSDKNKSESNQDFSTYILIFCSMICNLICLIISFMIRRKLKKIEVEYILPIHLLIHNLSDMIFVLIFLINIGVIYLSKNEYYFICEYTTILIYSFYKSILLTVLIFFLDGWNVLIFNNFAEKFKKISKFIFYYDLIISIISSSLVYFFIHLDKVKLYYIKDVLEIVVLIFFCIKSFFYKMIPLIKQTNYEQRLRTNLVKCYLYKKKKFILIHVLIIFYCSLFFFSPLFEDKYTFMYNMNFPLHLIVMFIIESFLFFGITFIFWPQKIPKFYLDEVVFNYKTKIFLMAKFVEREGGEDKMDVRELTFEKLKMFSKKDKFPIVFVNPFSKVNDDMVFEQLHVGFVQKKKKKDK